MLDHEAKLRKTDNEVKTEIERLMAAEPDWQAAGNRKGKATDGVSLRQITRVTGISVDIIFKA